MSTPEPSATEAPALPRRHRVPVTWLFTHGGEAIRYRVLRDLNPPGTTPEQSEAARQVLLASKLVSTVVKKQKDSGLWGANLLAVAASAKDGIKEAGTIAQYRRLLRLGAASDLRAMKLAERVLFRMLSRDEDPALLFEYQKLVAAEPAAAGWVRGQLRAGACCALAEAGYVEDPRLRGAAHKVASDVSAFLRSPLADKPFVRAGSGTALHPEAHPPSWHSVAMVAAMPGLQRERAGFTERLGHYLSQPAPKKTFSIGIGKKSLKPHGLLLGDPVETDAKGMPKDIPLALQFLDLLAQLHALPAAEGPMKVLDRLLKDVDEEGIWAPRGLRGAPKATDPWTVHDWPLVAETKSAESRAVDVTFRLARIAKRIGWELEWA